MALKTRVWGAGKLLLLGGALLLTYVLFAAASMRIALKTREVVVPLARPARRVNEATALLADAGLNLKVEEARRVDPKIPAGQIICAGSAGRRQHARERSVKVWVSAGPRIDHRAGAARRIRAHGAAAAAAGRPRARRDRRDSVGDYPADASWRRRRRQEHRRRGSRCSSIAASAAPPT